MAGALRIVLAEDAVLLRTGLAELLRAFGHQVPAAVGDGDELIAAVDRVRPDVVVTDVRMPPGFSDEGLRSAVHLRSHYPDLGVLVLSHYVATSYAVELLQSAAGSGGGIGYLLKDRVGAVSDFVDAVERIAAGGTVIDPDVIRELLACGRRAESLRRLTPREHEVLTLMAQGRTNPAIAAVLRVTPATVAKCVGSIFVKLNLSEADGHRRVLAVLAYLKNRAAMKS